MSPDIVRIEAGIRALEAQRDTLGDEVVDLALAPLRQRLAALKPGGAETGGVSLRQVTVLFADAVDFTRLAHGLDPEDVGAVMDDVLARGTAVVVAQGGRVLQYAGDSLLAVFGDDDAADQGPARAVHAALGLLDLGRTVAAELRATRGHHGFDLRVGVHTGRVKLGGGVDEAGSIRGVSVNVAARLQQAAPPGAVLVSHDTWWQVRGDFDAEPLAPLQVKGLDAPLRCVRILRARPQDFAAPARGIDGVEVPMVGRDAELHRLQAAFDALGHDGTRLQRLLVVGEAGAGKSRLLRAFADALARRAGPATVFRGSATPQMRSQPHGLLRQMLGAHFALADARSLDIARQRFFDGVRALFDDLPSDAAAVQVHLVGHLIGLGLHDGAVLRGLRDDARQLRQRAFDATLALLRRIAARRRAPLVMLLEDLHWADEASLDLLDHLAAAGQDLPLLMAGAARPELQERRQAAGLEPWGIELPLRPLGREHGLALVDALLRRVPSPPPALRERLLEGTGGNPFFVQERVRMLIDAGGIVVGDGAWTVDEAQTRSLPMPPTLVGVLQARLDGLPADERSALQWAAVVGPQFPRDALRAIAPGAADAVPALCRRGLLVPQAADGGWHDHGFCHQLLQQVAYDTLPRALRQRAHAATARWLVDRLGLGPDADGVRGAAWTAAGLSMVAEHFDRGGERAQAAAYYAQAAEQAGQSFAHDALLSHVARGLDLADAQALPLRWQLIAARERTLNLLGRRDEQLQDLQALDTLAEALDDDRLRAQAAWRRCDRALHVSDFVTQEAQARRALSLARACGDETLALRATQRLAIALAHQGHAAEGLALAEAAMHDAQARGLPELECSLANAAALCASERGEQDLGLRYCQRSLALARTLGDRKLEAVELGNVGMGLVYFGDYVGARGWLERAVAMEREVGNRKIESADLSMLAELCVRQGDAGTALAHAQQALAIADAVQAPLYQCEAACALGAAWLARGDAAAAMAAFVDAEAIARRIPHDGWVLNGLEGQVRAARAAGDGPGARALAERLAALAAAVPADTLAAARQHRIRLTLVEVWAEAGDARAAALLGAARAALQAEAQRIADPALRHSFLHAVQEHRVLMAGDLGADAAAGAGTAS